MTNYLLKTICEDGVWRKIVNVSSATNPRHSIKCFEIANMPSTMDLGIHLATQWGPLLSGGSHQNGGGQSKSSQDLCCRWRYISFERAFHRPARKTDSLRGETYSVLAEANDWTVAADLEGLSRYPQFLRRMDAVHQEDGCCSSGGWMLFIRRMDVVHQEDGCCSSGGWMLFIRRMDVVHQEDGCCSSGGWMLFIRRMDVVHQEDGCCSSGGWMLFIRRMDVVHQEDGCCSSDASILVELTLP